MSLNNWRVTQRHLRLYNDGTIGIQCTHASLCKAPPRRRLNIFGDYKCEHYLDGWEIKIQKYKNNQTEFRNVMQVLRICRTETASNCYRSNAWSNHTIRISSWNGELGDLWDLSTVFQLAIFLWIGFPFVTQLFVVDLFMIVNELGLWCRAGVIPSHDRAELWTVTCFRTRYTRNWGEKLKNNPFFSGGDLYCVRSAYDSINKYLTINTWHCYTKSDYMSVGKCLNIWGLLTISRCALEISQSVFLLFHFNLNLNLC